jgi:hypothetical protein
MSPVLVVIADIFIQQPTQMPAIQHDHVIQQVPSYATNPALRNSVLPRTAEGGAHRLESQCPLFSAAIVISPESQQGTERCLDKTGSEAEVNSFGTRVAADGALSRVLGQGKRKKRARLSRAYIVWGYW